MTDYYYSKQTLKGFIFLFIQQQGEAEYVKQYYYT